MADDLVYGDLTVQQLRNLDWISWVDFTGYTPEMHRNEWESMAKTFATGELQNVVLDMIDHFMDGTGNTYSNIDLTTAVYAHQETQAYISSVQNELSDLLRQSEGEMIELQYDASNRIQSPLVGALRDAGIMSPSYDTLSDTVNGLRICVDSLWGNKVEVVSYSVSGNSYVCTLRYTLYDHFGLNQPDVEKYGLVKGFRSWYILQHCSEYNDEYRPFLTLIEFEGTFTGTIS